ncbi:MAG: hypothetical protein ACJA2U_001260 [Marinomonas primoryensis]|jgi:hypothetical protein
MHIHTVEKNSINTDKYMNNSTFIRVYMILKTEKRTCVLFHLSMAHNFRPECSYSLILRDFFTFCQYKTRHQLFVAVFKVDLQMKASLSLPDYASLIRPTSLVLPELKFQSSQFDSIPIARLYGVSWSLTERLS